MCDTEEEVSGEGAEGAPELALAILPALIEALQRLNGQDFSGYKPGTLVRRVRQRMQHCQARDEHDYLRRVEADAQERAALSADWYIHVSEFFRDPAVWEYILDEVLPDLLRGRAPSDELRLWCAGCAAGEEAYTLAMLALEAASRMGFHGNVKVFATDVAPAVLDVASRGHYSAQAVASVPEPLLRRYFQREPDTSVRADATLRRHIVFARHNLLADPPFTRIDLAVCRNVLIYLRSPEQLQLMGSLHFALKPQGMLLLGSSETVGALEGQGFEAVDRSHKLFRRQSARWRPAPPSPAPGAFVGAEGVAAVSLPLDSEVTQSTQLLQAELLSTRERLQEMVLELQASHERLDLSNEELTASNEELQSTNEELKSVNENLYSLNRELESKNQDLLALNRDYDLLLASTEIGTVFMDSALCVQRISPGVQAYLSLQPSDLGRSVADFHYRLGAQADFLQRLQRCLSEGARLEREVPMPHGRRWVLERMLPFNATQGQGVVLTWTDITEVKRMQSLAEALAADRTRLRAILDALPEGVYIASADHTVEYLNPALERGRGPVQDRKCYDYFHGLDAPCPWCKKGQVLQGETVRWEWTSPKGRTYAVFAMPFRNPDGTLSKFEMLHDISDLHDSRRRTQEVAQLAQVGHWEWVLATGELRWSDEVFACFGYAPGAVVPSFEGFLQHVVDADRARVQAAVQKALDQGESYEAQFQYTACDGSVHSGRATGRVVRDTLGQAVVMSGAMQDITALRQSEERFRVAFRASPLAVSITRCQDGVFVDVNDKYERYFGWRRDELLGKTAVDLGLWRDERARQDWLQELESAGTTLGHETQCRTRDGDMRHVSLSAELITVDNEPCVLGFMQDITERKRSEARIEFLAHHDPLTQLPNRVLFRDRFALATAWSERKGSRVAMLFVDLDQFKAVNDSLGHPVGDMMLQEVAQRLRACVRDTDTISRLGGDEFLMALTDVQELDAVHRIATHIVATLAQPMQLQGHVLRTTISMGVAIWPDDGNDFDALLQRADTAMYQAKASGRNAHRFYTAEMNAQALEHLQLKNALHNALERQEFVLHYQPQLDLLAGGVTGVEALLRWHCGEDLVEPKQFIAAAEESGLIVPIGAWVLQQACAQVAQWEREGVGALHVAVNVSAVQLRRGDLWASVTQALAQAGLAPQRLELELTESVLLEDDPQVADTLRRLKALGVGLSIDDFGTGYSSLAYLKRFAVDRLKIDQSFVRDIVRNAEDAAIVRAIISMARSLRLGVLAEGVESEETAAFLRLHQCEHAQGYHFARPMAAGALPAWLLSAGVRAPGVLSPG